MAVHTVNHAPSQIKFLLYPSPLYPIYIEMLNMFVKTNWYLFSEHVFTHEYNTIKT